MKYLILGVLTVILLLSAGCSASSGTSSEGAPVDSMTPQNGTGQMTVISSGVTDGYIDAAYGANGTEKKTGIPVLSLPLEITGAPEGTVCFAVYMDDPDAKPLCGYNWVHWMAANISQSSIPEDFSRTAQDNAVQGKNDSGTIGYAGPTPPDKDHAYIITVYALDARLALSDGFSKAEFTEAIQGHVLASATLEGIYKK